MPSQYGDIDVVEIPSSDIWVPDIVLYNNADGTYEVNTITKAHVVSRISYFKIFVFIFLLSIGMGQ
jgi:Neurotransmitter-gated ion-channel ligand binding domain